MTRPVLPAFLGLFVIASFLFDCGLAAEVQNPPVTSTTNGTSAETFYCCGTKGCATCSMQDKCCSDRVANPSTTMTAGGSLRTNRTKSPHPNTASEGGSGGEELSGTILGSVGFCCGPDAICCGHGGCCESGQVCCNGVCAENGQCNPGPSIVSQFLVMPITFMLITMCCVCSCWLRARTQQSGETVHLLDDIPEEVRQLSLAGIKPQNLGLPQHAIDAIPSVKYEEAAAKGGNWTMCSICLSDYGVGDTLRVLPCAHTFHVYCIDKWLLQNRACPLCKRAVSLMGSANNV